MFAARRFAQKLGKSYNKTLYNSTITKGDKGEKRNGEEPPMDVFAESSQRRVIVWYSLAHIL